MDELIRVVVDDAPATAAFNRIASAGAGADKAVSGLGAAVDKTQSAINKNTSATKSNTSAAKANQQQVQSNQGAFATLANSANSTAGAMGQMWNVGKVAIFAHAVGRVWDGMVSGANNVLDRLTEIQQTMSLLSAVDESSVGDNFDYVLETADKYGVRISALQDNYAKLSMAAKDTAMSTDDVRKIFEATSTAARVLHLRNSEVNLAFMAIVQMASKGTVSMEELRRQFAERIPGAIPALARELGVSTAALIKFVSAGNAAADKMLPFLATALERTYGPGLAKASTALDAEINRIDNSLRVFYKQVYDNGGSTGPAAAIRALNEKLVQPEVAENFARWVNQISGSIEAFIESLTADDIEQAANTFLKVLQGIGNVAIMAGNGIKWMADNLNIIAPVMGALLGAKTGASMGGWIGAGVGAVVGGLGASLAVGSLSGGKIAASPTSIVGMQDQLNTLTAKAKGLEVQLSKSVAPMVKAVNQRELNEVNAQINSTRDKLGEALLNRDSPADKFNTQLPDLMTPGTGNLAKLIGGGSGKSSDSAASKAAKARERQANELQSLLDKLYSTEGGISKTFNKELQVLYKNFDVLGIEKYVDAVETLITTQKFYKDQVKFEKDVVEDLAKSKALELQATERLTEAEVKWIEASNDPVFKTMSEVQQKRIRSLFDEKVASDSVTAAILAQRDAIKDLNDELADNLRSLDELNKTSQDTVTSARTGKSMARLAAERRMGLLDDRRTAITDFGGPGASDIVKATEEEMSALQQTLGAGGKKMRSEELEEWSNQWKNVSDGFLSAMMQGGKGVADYLKNMFKQVLTEALFRPIANDFANMMVGSSFGSGSGTGTGVLGALTSFLSFEGGGNTPSGPRSGGLDGKGGFMAVVHPNETWVDNTKPSKSSGPSNQYFSVVINNTVGDVASKSMVEQSNAAVMMQVRAAFQRSQKYGGETSRG